MDTQFYGRLVVLVCLTLMQSACSERGIASVMPTDLGTAVDVQDVLSSDDVGSTPRECSNAWVGDACDVCPSNYTGAACDTCSNGWTGDTCDTCPVNYTGAACDTCANGWTGDACDICPSNYAGGACDTCSNGWTGDACDVCPSNYTGAACDTCSNGWTGDTCDTCPVNYTGAACDTCANAWTGDACEICPPNWSGDACDTCNYDCVVKPYVIAGFITPEAPSGCEGGVYWDDDWMDCDRDSANAECAPLGYKVHDYDGCAYTDGAGPVEACKCIYGSAIVSAQKTNNTSPTGCPVFECVFLAEPPGPAASACPIAASSITSMTDGYDWSVPESVSNASHSGFYTRKAGPFSDARDIKWTWAQLNPAEGVYSKTTAGTFSGYPTPTYLEGLADPGPVWIRVFTAQRAWAPDWVEDVCEITYFPLYGGEEYLPIWDPCVWGHMLDMYRVVFQEWGLAANPDVQFLYVPGGFYYAEFAFGPIEDAFLAGALTFEAFDAWFTTAWVEFADIFNGENDDPGDDYAYKLVFTGEDYPYSSPFGAEDDLYAQLVVMSGLGIRNGITENYDNHHNHQPAYGATINNLGHVETDESWELFDGQRIIGTENECYTACGTGWEDLPMPPWYVPHAIVMSNLRALQMRVNWIYVEPTDSYLEPSPEEIAAYDMEPYHIEALWQWVRKSIGHTPETAWDAWAALREARDNYWDYAQDETPPAHHWLIRPWVKNIERWLVQRDVAPDGISARGGVPMYGDLFYESTDLDHVAYDGRRTDWSAGQTALYFDLYDGLAWPMPTDVTVRVTYLDEGMGSWHLEYDGGGCMHSTPSVIQTGTGQLRTVTFELESFDATGALPGGTDLAVRVDGESDVEVHFIRVTHAMGD